MKRYLIFLFFIPLILPAQNRHSKGIAFIDLQGGAIYEGLGGYSFGFHGGKYLSQKLFFRAGINREEYDFEKEGSHYIFERKVTASGVPYLDTLWVSSRRHNRYQSWFLSGDLHFTFFQPNESLFFNVLGGARLGMEKSADITESRLDLEELESSFVLGGYAGLELEVYLGSALALIGQLRQNILNEDQLIFRPTLSGGIKIAIK